MSETVREDQIRKIIEDKLEPKHLEVIDESGGCGASFRVIVVSEHFAGKTTLASHRLVNTALADLMPEIHALTLNTMTPEKWEQKQQQGN